MNQENMEEDISDIQEAVARLFEKVKAVSKKVSDLERDERQVSELKANSEVRLRMLESEQRRLVDALSDLEGRMKMVELTHDSGRERWKTVANFVIQLVWVAMAAFLLTKLGLQGPL